MSIVKREGNEFTKPVNPMSPNNSNWDKTDKERIKDLEDRVQELEINILQLFSRLLVLVDENNKGVNKEQIKDSEEDKPDVICDDMVREHSLMPNLASI